MSTLSSIPMHAYSSLLSELELPAVPTAYRPNRPSNHLKKGSARKEEQLEKHNSQGTTLKRDVSSGVEPVVLPVSEPSRLSFEEMMAQSRSTSNAYLQTPVSFPSVPSDSDSTDEDEHGRIKIFQPNLTPFEVPEECRVLYKDFDLKYSPPVHSTSPKAREQSRGDDVNFHGGKSGGANYEMNPQESLVEIRNQGYMGIHIRAELINTFSPMLMVTVSNIKESVFPFLDVHSSTSKLVIRVGAREGDEVEVAMCNRKNNADGIVESTWALKKDEIEAKFSRKKALLTLECPVLRPESR